MGPSVLSDNFLFWRKFHFNISDHRRFSISSILIASARPFCRTVFQKMEVVCRLCRILVSGGDLSLCNYQKPLFSGVFV